MFANKRDTNHRNIPVNFDMTIIYLKLTCAHPLPNSICFIMHAII